LDEGPLGNLRIIEDLAELFQALQRPLLVLNPAIRACESLVARL
jgi:hypothetical protein